MVLRYWGEKLVAVGKHGGYKEYDSDLFVAAVKQSVDEWIESNGENAEFREAVKDEVRGAAWDGEHEAIRAAMEFVWEGERVWPDFYERTCREYTYQFLWCCHAIVWAIQQWDARTAAAEVVAA